MSARGEHHVEHERQEKVVVEVIHVVDGFMRHSQEARLRHPARRAQMLASALLMVDNVEWPFRWRALRQAIALPHLIALSRAVEERSC